LLASNGFVVDACRHVVRRASTVVSLAKRPVLCALARALSEAWPGDVPRDALVARAFGAKLADESHRARLRVEVGRLRTVLRTLADVSATQRGFALAPRTRGDRAGPASAGIHDHLVTPLACGRPAECSPRSRRPAAAVTRG